MPLVFCCICHSLTFNDYIFVYMDTNEILKKLDNLLGLEQKFKESHPNWSYSDILEFRKANGWPIVTELQTPLGVLTVLDETGTKIPFLISYSYWFLYRENEERKRYKKVLDNITAMLMISLDANDLEKRKIYRVHLSGEKIQHEDGDEWAECYTKVKDNMILALQQPVVNDLGHWESVSLADLNFEGYSWKVSHRYVTICDDHGFYFILKDKTIPVEFDIAWMNMDGIGEYDCEDVLSYYLIFPQWMYYY